MKYSFFRINRFKMIYLSLTGRIKNLDGLHMAHRLFYPRFRANVISFFLNFICFWGNCAWKPLMFYVPGAHKGDELNNDSQMLVVNQQAPVALLSNPLTRKRLAAFDVSAVSCCGQDAAQWGTSSSDLTGGKEILRKHWEHCGNGPETQLVSTGCRAEEKKNGAPPSPRVFERGAGRIMCLLSVVPGAPSITAAEETLCPHSDYHWSMLMTLLADYLS